MAKLTPGDRGSAAARRRVPQAAQDELASASTPTTTPRAAEGQGPHRPAPGARCRPQRDRCRARRGVALARHDGQRPVGPVVRTPPPPRQLSHRCSAGDVLAEPGPGQVLAHRDADRRPATELAENIDKGIAFSATSSRIHHFLLPAQGWGSRPRCQGRRGAGAGGPRCAQGVAQVDEGQADDEADPTAYGTWRARREALAVRPASSSIAEASRAGRSGVGSETPEHTPAVTRDQIEASLSDENGATAVSARDGPLVRHVVLAPDRD